MSDDELDDITAREARARAILEHARSLIESALFDWEAHHGGNPLTALFLVLGEELAGPWANVEATAARFVAGEVTEMHLREECHAVVGKVRAAMDQAARQRRAKRPAEDPEGGAP